jgi:hypothetical protein
MIGFLYSETEQKSCREPFDMIIKPASSRYNFYSKKAI